MQALTSNRIKFPLSMRFIYRRLRRHGRCISPRNRSEANNQQYTVFRAISSRSHDKPSIWRVDQYDAEREDKYVHDRAYADKPAQQHQKRTDQLNQRDRQGKYIARGNTLGLQPRPKGRDASSYKPVCAMDQDED